MDSTPVQDAKFASNTSINVDEIRTNMLQKPSYVASPDFLRLTSWVACNGHDYLFKSTGFSPFPISIVGVVSSQGLYMQPYGNFSPETVKSAEETSSLAHARYKISLSPPIEYPGFMLDFRKALSNIRILYKHVETAKDGPTSDENVMFLDLARFDGSSSMTNQRVFNLDFRIFRKRSFPFHNKAQWHGYKKTLPEDYREFVDDLIEDYTIRPFAICHYEGEDINPQEFHSAIEGALVEVQFTLSNIYKRGLFAEPSKIKIIKQRE